MGDPGGGDLCRSTASLGNNTAASLDPQTHPWVSLWVEGGFVDLQRSLEGDLL